MRRKAQAVVVSPSSTATSGDALVQELLSLLQGGIAAPAPISNPHANLPPDANLGDVAATEAQGAMELIESSPMEAAGEAMEASAFEKLQCGLDCIQEGLAIFKQYEEMEIEEKEGKGEKAEAAALKKIDKLVEDMKKVFEELKDAEIKEHEEKAEEAADGSGAEGAGATEASKKSEKSESDEENKADKSDAKASVKSFTRIASAKGLVPTGMQF